MTSVQDALSQFAARKQFQTMRPFKQMVNEKVRERFRLRQEKKWAEADAIRDDLNRLGFELEEHKIDCMISIPSAGYSWWIITDLAAEAEMRKRYDESKRA